MVRQITGTILFALSISSSLYGAAVENRSGDKTPSRVFASTTESVVLLVQAGCVRSGETVIDSRDNTVVCELPMGRLERLAARFRLKAPFARSPHAFVQFSVETLPSGESEVRASGWLEDEGTPKRSAALAGRQFDREMQSFLTGL